jgi:hypothetical protein
MGHAGANRKPFFKACVGDCLGYHRKAEGCLAVIAVVHVRSQVGYIVIKRSFGKAKPKLAKFQQDRRQVSRGRI